MTTLDIKKISVYNFIEMANSQGIIREYFNSTPDIDVEYFSSKEENQILHSKEFNALQSVIDKKFA
jgi:hypothetical protein